MNKIRAKEILEARHQGLSMNEIAKTLHVSKHSVSVHIAERNSRECGAERSRSGVSGLFFNQYIFLIIR